MALGATRIALMTTGAAKAAKAATGPREPRGRGGPRGRGRGRIHRGDVRTAILLVLADEPMHGYQIMQAMSDRTGGAGALAQVRCIRPSRNWRTRASSQPRKRVAAVW